MQIKSTQITVEVYIESMELLRHMHNNDILTICRSLPDPLLYVVTRVEEQASEYQGMLPFSVALLMDSV